MKQRAKVLFVVVMILVMLFSMGVTSAFGDDAEWVYKRPMPYARSGMWPAVVDEKIYIMGSITGANRVDIYDTVTDTWSIGPKLPTARRSSAAAAVNGVIYVIGGYLNVDLPIVDARRLDSSQSSEPYKFSAVFEIDQDQVWILGMEPFRGDENNLQWFLDFPWSRFMASFLPFVNMVGVR